MKQFLRLTALAALVCTILGSCKKNDPNWQNPFAKARIKALIYNNNDTLKFEYNAKGNPTKITRHQNSTGSPSYRFNYDQNDRLLNCISYYTENTFERAQVFFYDNNGRVVNDSVYLWGEYYGNVIVGNPHISHGRGTYTWDNQNRIATIDRIFTGPFNSDSHDKFKYNTTGNLDTYTVNDGKPNIRQLHPIWQLISGDFSVNNGFVANTYNGRQLPVNVGNVGYPASNFIPELSLYNVEVIYE